jgi:hypothetical protein
MYALTRTVTDGNLDTEHFFILFAANLYFTIVSLGMMDFKSISFLFFETCVTYFSCHFITVSLLSDFKKSSIFVWIC